MRKLNPHTLKNTAISYNRKKWKKEMVDSIKTLNRRFKDCSKKGHTGDSVHVTEERHGYQAMIVFRWYRRYSGLNVGLTEEISQHQGKRYIDKISMSVNWR